MYYLSDKPDLKYVMNGEFNTNIMDCISREGDYHIYEAVETVCSTDEVFKHEGVMLLNRILEVKNGKVIEENSREILEECLVSEYEVLSTYSDVLKTTLNISESASGFLLTIIPKLIKLLMMLISKIYALLAIPIVASIVANTGNSQRAIGAVVTGKATLNDISVSLNRNTLNAVSEGNALKALDSVVILRKSLNETRSEIRKEWMSSTTDMLNSQYIESFMNKTCAKMEEKFEKHTSSDKRVYRNVIDMKRLLKTVYDVILSTFDFGIYNEELSKNITFMSDVMNSRIYAVDFSPSMVEDFKKIAADRYEFSDFKSMISILNKMSDDIENDKFKLAVSSDRVFEEIYDEKYLKWKKIHEQSRISHTRFLSDELFNNSYIINDKNEYVSNLKIHDYGDFKRGLFNGNILEVTEATRGRKEYFQSMVFDSIYELGRLHINKKDERILQQKKTDIIEELKKLDDKVENMGGGIDTKHLSYLSSILDFIKSDFDNASRTVIAARRAYKRNSEAMFVLIDSCFSSVFEAMITFIEVEVEQHPEEYRK